MAIYVSVRFQVSKDLRGQSLHDFSKRPAYSDRSKEGENFQVNLGNGSNYQPLDEFVKTQGTELIARYQSSEGRGRKWRTDSKTHLIGLIHFGGDFSLIQDDVDKAELDQRAKAYVLDFCKANGCQPSYLVRHEDETTTHYHFMVTNVNEESWKPLKLKKKELSEAQTKIAEIFEPMQLPQGLSFSRGRRKNDRIKEAYQTTLRETGENLTEYRRRVYDKANVRHKSVGKLHRTLPADIAKKRQELEALISEKERGETALAELLAKKATAEANLATATAKVTKIEQDETASKANIQKLKNREQAYEARLQALKDEIASYATIDADIQAKKAEIAQDEATLAELKTRKETALRDFNEIEWGTLKLPVPRTVEVIVEKNEIEQSQRTVHAPIFQPSQVKPIFEVFEVAKQAKLAIQASKEELERHKVEFEDALIQQTIQQKQSANEEFAPALVQAILTSNISFLLPKRRNLYDDYQEFLRVLKSNDGWLPYENGTEAKVTRGGGIFARTAKGMAHDPKEIALTLLRESYKANPEGEFEFSGSPEVLAAVTVFAKYQAPNMKITCSDPDTTSRAFFFIDRYEDELIAATRTQKTPKFTPPPKPSF